MYTIMQVSSIHCHENFDNVMAGWETNICSWLYSSNTGLIKYNGHNWHKHSAIYQSLQSPSKDIAAVHNFSTEGSGWSPSDIRTRSLVLKKDINPCDQNNKTLGKQQDKTLFSNNVTAVTTK